MTINIDQQPEILHIQLYRHLNSNDFFYVFVLFLFVQVGTAEKDPASKYQSTGYKAQGLEVYCPPDYTSFVLGR